MNRKQSSKGEAWVWVTAMGLASGLFMILFLIGLVLVKGLEPFWPDRVAEVKLRETSALAVGGSKRFAGEVVKRQATIAHEWTEEAGLEVLQEVQFFIGNKDIFGFGFLFVPEAEIQELSHPSGLIRIERMEYGVAFGYPVALERPGVAPVTAEAPGFRNELREFVRTVRERRDAIREIERDEIGAINRRLTQLQYAEAAPAAAGSDGSRMEREREELEARYEELAAKARSLREEQAAAMLKYRLASGEEVQVEGGQVVRFTFPNELSVVQQAGLFAANVWNFLREDPREANTEGGIFPAIFGTFVLTLLMSVAVMPVGVVGAIYLREYATQGPVVRAVRIAVNNLAGVPSIVFGVFGLGFFVYFVGSSVDELLFSEQLPTPTFGTGGILWASLTLALMTVPVVIVATEEALAAVSRGTREASLACGASKWQTIQRVVLPPAAPGILTGLILAMARGAGEVAPLMLVGVVKLAPDLPLNTQAPFLHLDQKFMHLGFHIFDLGFQSPDSEAAKPMVFATTLFLIALVLVLNLAAIIIRERLRRRYATSAF